MNFSKGQERPCFLIRRFGPGAFPDRLTHARLFRCLCNIWVKMKEYRR